MEFGAAHCSPVLGHSNPLRAKNDHDLIHGDQLELFYQPQVATVTGSATGAEGLLRRTVRTWSLSPESFYIPLSETTSALEIEGWILRTAGQQLAAMACFRAGPPNRAAAIMILPPATSRSSTMRSMTLLYNMAEKPAAKPERRTVSQGRSEFIVHTTGGTALQSAVDLRPSGPATSTCSLG